MKKAITKQAKPDYIDIDGDGNKKEPMKEAAKSMAKQNDKAAKDFIESDKKPKGDALNKKQKKQFKKLSKKAAKHASKSMAKKMSEDHKMAYDRAEIGRLKTDIHDDDLKKKGMTQPKAPTYAHASFAKQFSSKNPIAQMKSNQDGGGDSTTEAADQLKRLQKQYSPKLGSSAEGYVRPGYDKDGKRIDNTIKPLKDGDYEKPIHGKHYEKQKPASIAKQTPFENFMQKYPNSNPSDTLAVNDPREILGYPTERRMDLNKAFDDTYSPDPFITMDIADEEITEEEGRAQGAANNAKIAKEKEAAAMKEKLYQDYLKSQGSATPQNKTMAYKKSCAYRQDGHGESKGDQSATHTDYANYKGTDKGYHGKTGSSHGDQSATHRDYAHPIFKHMKR